MHYLKRAKQAENRYLLDTLLNVGQKVQVGNDQEIKFVNTLYFAIYQNRGVPLNILSSEQCKQFTTCEHWHNFFSVSIHNII